MSNLSPLRRRDEGVDEGSGPVFCVDVRRSEPVISVVGTPVTGAEQRLAKEITRIIDDRSPFSGQVTDEVSIPQNPYLMHMLEGVESVGLPSGELIRFVDEPSSMVLALDFKAGEKRVQPRFELRMAERTLTDFAFLSDEFILSGAEVMRIASVGSNYLNLSVFLAPVEVESLAEYLTIFMTFVSGIDPEINGTPARYSAHPEQSLATIYLEKVATDKSLYMRTGESLESLGPELPAKFRPTVSVSVSEEGRATVRRVIPSDIEEKTENLHAMILDCAPNRAAKKEVYRDKNFFIVPEETAGPFLLKNLPRLLEEFKVVGSDKLREYKVVAVKPKTRFELASGIDFLEGTATVAIENEEFTLADLLKQFQTKRYVTLSDGTRGILDERYMKRLQRLFRRTDKAGNIRLTMFDLPEIEEVIEEKVKGEFAAHSRAVLQGFNDLKKAKAPKLDVEAKLRPYQVEGVKWLKYLYDNNLGGCLADDMGLGKTLQTISLLSMVYPKAERPTLIVMPRSLLFNWERELDRFCPRLTHSTYYGPDRNLTKALKSQIVLTTYAMVRNDIDTLKDVDFEYVILDESQNIKNISAQTTAAVNLLTADHRLALSGTPMENNLTELYSLFLFLNPQMFGTLEDFNSSYTYPIHKFGDKDASASLRRKIFPFILRRLKKDVLNDLPDRIDQTIYVEMSQAQARLYEERRVAYKAQIEQSIHMQGVAKSQFAILQALGELRKIASVPETASEGKISSPKVEELIESLISSVENGHKSVVFFNFLAGMELAMARLDKLGINYETMTGSTSAGERKRIVDRFQTAPECMVLLLTLKVGGVGLNLTAADTVYIFEPWWNKAAEEQAINRLHRIGQKKTVNSYSIITVGTIEEKILQLQAQKSELFNELISSDTSSTKSLTEQDINFILS